MPTSTKHNKYIKSVSWQWFNHRLNFNENVNVKKYHLKVKDANSFFDLVVTGNRRLKRDVLPNSRLEKYEMSIAAFSDSHGVKCSVASFIGDICEAFICPL